VKASINSNWVTNELTITIQGLNWADTQQAAFYEGELQVRTLLKLIGFFANCREDPKMLWWCGTCSDMRQS